MTGEFIKDNKAKELVPHASAKAPYISPQATLTESLIDITN